MVTMTRILPILALAACATAQGGSFYTGGSGGGSSYTADGDIYDPFVPPASPSAFDDEFDDDTVTGWTEWDPSGGDLVAVSEDDGGLLLTMTNDPGAGTSFMGVYKTAPATAEWEAVSYMCLEGPEDADFTNVGLVVFEDAAGSAATTDLRGFILQSNTGSPNEMGNYLYTAYTTYSAKVTDTPDEWCWWAALQVREDTPDTAYSVQTWYSEDGASWRTPGAAAGSFPDADEVGLVGDPYDNDNIRARFRVFRVTRTGASGIFDTNPGPQGGRREYTTP